MKIKPSGRPGGVLVELDCEDDHWPGQTQVAAAPVAPVFRLKRILVPTDFSECSKAALAFALPFARQFNAHLAILHVAEFQYAGSELANTEIEFIEQETICNRRERLKQWVKTCVPEGIECDAFVAKGRAVREIISLARSKHVDLIVMATRGWVDGTESVLGTTAERVVRQAPCPVLIVPASEFEPE